MNVEDLLLQVTERNRAAFVDRGVELKMESARRRAAGAGGSQSYRAYL